MTGPEPPCDDLGHPVRAVRPARRVVSLVPSLTESVAATRRPALVGATDWCTHPAGLDVTRVRGTKNPNLAARGPELVVLPDEPYPFSAGDGPEMFPGRRVALVEGRSLTWYGPSLVTARSLLAAQLAAAQR